MTTYLEEHLGRRIPTKELAAWLQLDVDAVRRHYQAFGGIRPVPGGKILFFEANVVDALRGEYHGIKDSERRTYPVERPSPEEWTDQAETLQHQGRSLGMGGRGKKSGLGEDRHGLLPAGMGGKVSGPQPEVRQKNLHGEKAGISGTVRGKNRQKAADSEPERSCKQPDSGQGAGGINGTV